MKNTSRHQTGRRARKLRIHRETLRQLNRGELREVAGGIRPESGWTLCVDDCPRTAEC